MELQLVAEPTFKAKVGIPLPGKENPVYVEFTFKHRTRDEFSKFSEENVEKKIPDLDYVFEVATGWGLKEEFNRDNVATLLQNYHGAARAIAQTYAQELMGFRVKT